MPRLEWNTGARPYFSGVDRGVLYLPGYTPIPWNGLISVAEKSVGAGMRMVHFDGDASGLEQNNEDFELSVAAYTYPAELENFMGFSGSVDKQRRKSFGMSYRIGDSKTGQIHLVYNAMIQPSTKPHSTVANDVSLDLFTFDISTTPMPVSGFRSMAHLVIDLASTKAETLTALLNVLYGTATTNPRLPSPTEIFRIFEDTTVFQVIDNGDGTWTARGPDSAFQTLPSGAVNINWGTIFAVSTTTYVLLTDYGLVASIVVLDNGDGTWTASGPDSVVKYLDATTFEITWPDIWVVSETSYVLPTYD